MKEIKRIKCKNLLATAHFLKIPADKRGEEAKEARKEEKAEPLNAEHRQRKTVVRI